MEKIYTGSLLGDYIFCKRKFYLISKGISPDNDNEDMIIGKQIDAKSYPREERDVLLGKNLIDFIGPDGKIHEIKKSSNYQESHIIQLQFYLYIYKRIFGKEIEGVLNYPEERKNFEVKLTPEDEEHIEDILMKMDELLESDRPPEMSQTFKCAKCAFLPICRG